MNKIELGPHVEVDLEHRKRDIAKGQDIQLSIFGSIRKQNGVNELVARMFRQQGRGFLLQCAQENPTQSALVNVISHVEQCLAETIDIDQLARIACMSRSKLYSNLNIVLGAARWSIFSSVVWKKPAI